MSKVLAITYSFLILIQSFNINLEDISKVKALLDHAQFHKEVYGDTFFEFLTEHYGEVKDDHKNDHKEHKDLPFKDSHHMCTHINTSFINIHNTFDLNYHEFIEIPFNFHYTETITDSEKPSIFQPPKIA
ncbi:hypothetical protein Q4512_01510 [Oceanihabitans sp. 2_MG-2023]|uniref:hypothetical protein n=1 Tax=Oceanihabitans sp. 2_MG-2023 TaxID=3062661 RepID=UPI0026E42190|nr:hypothetical protein [Oceanihabitans sp. 2_MG-2023]MDO6595569.1 hypothetical protein [Oceanihabitans sp. 2_MG-2023]